MILLIHILAALTSLLVCGTAYLRPSRRLLNASYGLVGLTLASGTYMAVHGPAHILSVCLSGLLYLGAVSFSLTPVRRYLAEAQVKRL
jgi:hypothetical protein